VAIDAVIRDVVRDGDALPLDLEPRRYRPEVAARCGYHFSIPGQSRLYIDNPTWTPQPGMAIWGGDSSVEIVNATEPQWYVRTSYTRMQER